MKIEHAHALAVMEPVEAHREFFVEHAIFSQFNLNGLGRLMFESVLNADYNMIQALVMVVAVVFVGTNLVIDLTYAWLDPRIRYG